MANKKSLLLWSKAAVAAAILLLPACAPEKTDVPPQPQSRTEQQLNEPLKAFAPPPPSASSEPPPAPVVDRKAEAATTPQAGMGIGGIARDATVRGDAQAGHDFAIDNCRPCHVVAADTRSALRFSNAPDFRTIANIRTTTPFSLTVWLTNPHPTMPTLVLTPQEADNVIAYILSLRDKR